LTKNLCREVAIGDICPLTLGMFGRLCFPPRLFARSVEKSSCSSLVIN